MWLLGVLRDFCCHWHCQQCLLLLVPARQTKTTITAATVSPCTVGNGSLHTSLAYQCRLSNTYGPISHNKSVLITAAIKFWNMSEWMWVVLASARSNLVTAQRFMRHLNLNLWLWPCGPTMRRQNSLLPARFGFNARRIKAESALVVPKTNGCNPSSVGVPMDYHKRKGTV